MIKLTHVQLRDAVEPPGCTPGSPQGRPTTYRDPEYGLALDTRGWVEISRNEETICVPWANVARWVAEPAAAAPADVPFPPHASAAWTPAVESVAAQLPYVPPTQPKRRKR